MYRRTWLYVTNPGDKFLRGSVWIKPNLESHIQYSDQFNFYWPLSRMGWVFSLLFFTFNNILFLKNRCIKTLYPLNYCMWTVICIDVIESFTLQCVIHLLLISCTVIGWDVTSPVCDSSSQVRSRPQVMLTKYIYPTLCNGLSVPWRGVVEFTDVSIHK